MLSYSNTNDIHWRSLPIGSIVIQPESLCHTNNAFMRPFMMNTLPSQYSLNSNVFSQEIYPVVLVECVQVPIGHFSSQYENFQFDKNQEFCDDATLGKSITEIDKFCNCTHYEQDEDRSEANFCDCYTKIHCNQPKSNDDISENIANKNSKMDATNDNQNENGENEELIPNYRCTHEGCNKMFYKKWNLSLHMKIHLDTKPFQCQYCSKKFVQKCNYTKHMRTHLVPILKERKIFKCSFCAKKYTQKYNLKVRVIIRFVSSLIYINSTAKKFGMLSTKIIKLILNMLSTQY